MILFSDKGRGFEAANIDDYFTMQFNEEIELSNPPPPLPKPRLVLRMFAYV